jgi:hypothetical protein
VNANLIFLDPLGDAVEDVVREAEVVGAVVKENLANFDAQSGG